eukprot:CAMPEP_0119078424 /NCGR_PEP_ID=MMETSP1178-20130426/100724_1 /TAXON_ID=33656 /ORGANISM="unid sp, Strain CCMP2000" /LENGTH=314 /DNA_ID=CAMNT_0007060873 /DNA_START=28 /DNA_END=973 /DNA_ORIENTATION=-
MVVPELSDDIWRKIALAVEHDPLHRCTAVYTNKVMFEAIPREQLAELKQLRQQASEVLSSNVLRAVRSRGCQLGDKYGKPLTLSQWRMLGGLARHGSLVRLERFIINGVKGEECVTQLAEGLRRGSLRSLKELWLVNAGLGPHGATALADVLTNRAVPSLEFISLAFNRIGDAGLTALAPALRKLRKLKTLNLVSNQIGNRGLASLLAPPTAGVLDSLEFLYLNDKMITDAGRATLVSALHDGVLPALKNQDVLRGEAMQAVRAAALACKHPTTSHPRGPSSAQDCVSWSCFMSAHRSALGGAGARSTTRASLP